MDYLVNQLCPSHGNWSSNILRRLLPKDSLTLKLLFLRLLHWIGEVNGICHPSTDSGVLSPGELSSQVSRSLHIGGFKFRLDRSSLVKITCVNACCEGFKKTQASRSSLIHLARCNTCIPTALKAPGHW